jgi:hypothetical protein
MSRVPQSPHLGTDDFFVLYCIASLPPGVLTLHDNPPLGV